MSLLAVGLIVSSVGVAVAVVLLVLFDDTYYNRHWLGTLGWFLIWPFGVALLFFGFVSVVVYSSRAVGRTTCHNWSVQTGYRTKFTILNWADTGTCLAETRGGRWVKNTSIIINAPEKP